MGGVAAARLGVALAQRCAAPAAAHAAAATQLPRRSRAWVSRGAAAAHVATGGSAASAAAVPPAHDSLPLPDPLGLLMSRVTPGDDMTVSGWVRHVRRQKRVAFATVSDGSAGGTLQVRRLDRVVVSHDVLDPLHARARTRTRVHACNHALRHGDLFLAGVLWPCYQLLFCCAHLVSPGVWCMQCV
jgi:hypothetical protein